MATSPALSGQSTHALFSECAIGKVYIYVYIELHALPIILCVVQIFGPPGQTRTMPIYFLQWTGEGAAVFGRGPLAVSIIFIIYWGWSILSNTYILFPGPGSLNPVFRPRGPSKLVGDVFKCIWAVFYIEVACVNM